MTELIGGGGGAGAHYLDSKTAILIVGLCFGLFTQSIFFFCRYAWESRENLISGLRENDATLESG